MYGLFGGCTTLLHLIAQYGIVVLALGFSELASQVPANPGPGDRYGTAGYLTRLQNQIVKEHPELAAKVLELRTEFDKNSIVLTEEQIRSVLAKTDACTDINVRDLGPDDRRKVAWILFLDSYAREGPDAARKFLSGPMKK
jgi:hypothetical protein